MCIPADANPDTKAGSRVYPDNLVSFAIIAICFFFFKFLKYVPAANPNLKNFSPLILAVLTVPLIPSVPKYFFFHLFINFSYTKIPCLTSSTLCTLKILIP